ncbi:MAG: hypothetical protein JWM40_1536 [Frankiales bacterium]|nr:hypothetical protein [Frankiales bacterium]
MALAQRPDPAPLETNDVTIVGGLALLWVLALAVLLVIKAAGGDVHTWWLLMCLEGALLGVVGVRYCQRRRAAIARDRAPGPL